MVGENNADFDEIVKVFSKHYVSREKDTNAQIPLRRSEDEKITVREFLKRTLTTPYINLESFGPILQNKKDIYYIVCLRGQE